MYMKILIFLVFSYNLFQILILFSVVKLIHLHIGHYKIFSNQNLILMVFLGLFFSFLIASFLMPFRYNQFLLKILQYKDNSPLVVLNQFVYMDLLSID